MIKKPVLAVIYILLLISLVIASACSQTSAQANLTVKQSPIKAQVSGDKVTIPVNSVEQLVNTRFTVSTPSNTLSFMAYKFDNQVQVRADICPPCGSQSFTLKNGTLVCDTCGTVFDAKTGDGIKGACVKFAKQSVAYEMKDGNIAMKGTDLVTAYQNTISPRK